MASGPKRPCSGGIPVRTDASAAWIGLQEAPWTLRSKGSQEGETDLFAVPDVALGKRLDSGDR